MSYRNLIFREQLNDLEEKGLLRRLLVLDSPQDAYISIEGKRLLNLCSNNYLGLANDLRLKRAAIKTIKEFGLGTGASRLISGTHKLHKRLEEELAKFKNQEACLVFNSGYGANLGIISTLVGKGDIVFSDRLNHASIIDGIILSRAEFRRFPHKDVLFLEELLKNQRARLRRALIITDTVFSMDGDIAPLPQLWELAKRYDCMFMVDEAHSFGVLGKNGRGTIEYFGLEKEKEIIQMGTLSKALGSFGAYVCGKKEFIDYLINRCRSFIYTTSLPVGIIAASREALKIIQEDTSLKETLLKNADFLRCGLRDLGFNTLESETQIIPILTKENALTLKFSQELFKEGIFVQGIRPPTVGKNEGRLRVSIMAAHKKKDLESALEIFKEIGESLGLI